MGNALGCCPFEGRRSSFWQTFYLDVVINIERKGEKRGNCGGEDDSSEGALKWDFGSIERKECRIIETGGNEGR